MIDGTPTALTVRSAQPEEPAQDAPATPTSLDVADDLLSVHTDWGDSKPNPCQEVDAFVEIITQFEATRPGVVRSIPVFVILQHSLVYACKGRLQELWYSSSQEAQVIDEFWSHSWQAPSWQKYVNLLFLNNTWPASVVGTFTAVAALVLFLTDVLPEWAETGRTCRWCILLGTVAYYPTFLFFRPSARVFFDAACINQRDMDLKFEGLVSMGAILKRSKSMLVLWDPSYVTRLWCVFEMAAFLNAHGSAAVKVCPPLLGTVMMICHFVLCVITFISHWLLQQDSWSWAYLATLPALWLPTFTFMAYAVRSYCRSIDTMDRQLRDFSIQQTTSSCCEGGHKDDDFCDRNIILRCISTWFGSIENFELVVQTEVRKALANQLVDGGFTYRRMVLATVPLLWSLLDRMASDVRDPLWAAGQLARLFAYWLTTVPSILILLFRLCYKFRASCGRISLEILLSLGLVIIGAAMYVATAAIDILFQAVFPSIPLANFALCGLCGIVTVAVLRYL